LRKQFKYFKFNETIYTKWFVFGIRLEWILFGIHSFLNASSGKTSSAKYKNKQNEPTEWIIAVAKHKGIIKGMDWVKVQKILEGNRSKGDSFRNVLNSISLLSGLVYCNCGHPMSPKTYPKERINEEGDRPLVYLCSQKEKSNRKNCDVSNIPGNTLDQMIFNEVLTLVNVDSDVSIELQKIRDTLELNLDSSTYEADM
jgi:site-specific DNA recombinase